MVRITIDDELKQKLLEARGSIELRDTDGKLVAHATKIPDGVDGLGDLFDDWDEDEIERRRQSNEPGMTTEELKARLRELP